MIIYSFICGTGQLMYNTKDSDHDGVFKSCDEDSEHWIDNCDYGIEGGWNMTEEQAIQLLIKRHYSNYTGDFE